MKKILSAVVAICMLFSCTTAIAAGKTSGESHGEITAKLNQPLSSILDPGGILSKFLESGKISCNVKYDLSDNSSLKMQLDMTSASSEADYNQSLSMWININLSNQEFATVSTIFKFGSMENYFYQTQMVNSEEAQALTASIKLMILATDQSFTNQYVSLLKKYGGKQTGQNIALSLKPSALWDFYKEEMDLYQNAVPEIKDQLSDASGISLLPSEMSAIIGQDEDEKILQTLIGNYLFGPNAITMNVKLSADGDYIAASTSDIHINCNLYDISKYQADYFGFDFDTSELEGTRADYQVNMTIHSDSSLTNVGKTTITQPTLTSENSTPYNYYSSSFGIIGTSNDSYSYDTDTYNNDNPAFEDISNHWAEYEINELSNQSIIRDADFDFNPNGYITRSYAANLLYNAHLYYEEILEDETKGNSFSDVEDNNEYLDAINWVANSHIMIGRGNHKFDPNGTVTREEFCVILNQYAAFAKKDITSDAHYNSFSDQNKISTFAKDSVEAMVKAGFVSGRVNGSFDPQTPITRAEACYILYYFLNN